MRQNESTASQAPSRMERSEMIEQSFRTQMDRARTELKARMDAAGTTYRVQRDAARAWFDAEKLRIVRDIAERRRDMAESAPARRRDIYALASASYLSMRKDGLSWHDMTLSGIDGPGTPDVRIRISILGPCAGEDDTPIDVEP